MVFNLEENILCGEHRPHKKETDSEKSQCDSSKYKHSWNTARQIKLVDQDQQLYNYI